MARFQYQKKTHIYRKSILSVCLFLLIVTFFFHGLDSLSEGSLSRQKTSLENALNRSITYCYSVEGSYPESLEYLTKHYGVVYDTDQFFVDYNVIGANVLPDITIIVKGD